MNRRLNTLVAAFALGTTLIACSNDGNGGTAATGTSTVSTESDVLTNMTAVAPTSTTSAPTTTVTTVELTTTTATTIEATTVATVTTVAADPASTVVAENDDWVAIIQGLVNVRDELYATSDPSRAGEVCADTAFCYQQLVAQLTDAQSKGWHVEGQGPLTISSADLEQQTSDNGVDIVLVRSKVQRTTQHGRMVDAAGDTVYDLVPSEEQPFEGEIRWTLVRLDAGWRLVDQETIT